MIDGDWPEVSRIYKEGLETGLATFEKTVPNWDSWNASHIQDCRFVAVNGENELLGWAALTAVSSRCVYAGVAEISVYIGAEQRGKGVGKLLLKSLIDESEAIGIWTLQAGIFPENKPSIALHEKMGFRLVGIREKIGQLDGVWKDNCFLERRSNKVGINNTMKNILVLCTGNSCRSQMAHGYLKKMTENRAVVYSAGVETHGLNPGAIAIMQEDGIDISNHTSNHVDEYMDIEFDFIITVCDHAKENCPYIPAKNAKRLHHNFFDPSKVDGTSEEIHAAFEKARNEIREFCEAFVAAQL